MTENKLTDQLTDERLVELAYEHRSQVEPWDGSEHCDSCCGALDGVNCLKGEGNCWPCDLARLIDEVQAWRAKE